MCTMAYTTKMYINNINDCPLSSIFDKQLRFFTFSQSNYLKVV